ncbi:hypothetical protein [Shimia thalassica]|uniref:hypothetical protein n=1 Tax=Shimia thalassica TaxID=1715693 RepID=UPI0026E4233A|nr:hypothetical protein [Shimia thalassica]MDO6480965.1 hypothetical protein [Shimia thalassica]
MDQGLHTISARDICAVYDVTTRTAVRWLSEGEEPSPRYRGGDVSLFALADLLPRIPRDPAPLLALDRQRRPDMSPEIDLGLEIAKRSKRLVSTLSEERQIKLNQVQSDYREAVARAFWEKVLFLDAEHLAQSLSLHPVIIQAVVADIELPEDWESFCIAFTLTNTSPKSLWRLTKSQTHHEGSIKYVV